MKLEEFRERLDGDPERRQRVDRIKAQMEAAAERYEKIGAAVAADVYKKLNLNVEHIELSPEWSISIYPDTGNFAIWENGERILASSTLDKEGSDRLYYALGRILEEKWRARDEHESATREEGTPEGSRALSPLW